jgi:transposase
MVYLTKQVKDYTMSNIKYNVHLTPEERGILINIISKGSAASAKEIMHANVLLTSDENSPNSRKTEAEIAEIFHIHTQTVYTIRLRFCQQGLSAALNRKKREKPPVETKITGELEAKIIALCCTTPPAGQSRWSLRLLADKAVELDYIDSISHVSVGTLLKKRIKAPSS